MWQTRAPRVAAGVRALDVPELTLWHLSTSASPGPGICLYIHRPAGLQHWLVPFPTAMASRSVARSRRWPGRAPGGHGQAARDPRWRQRPNAAAAELALRGSISSHSRVGGVARKEAPPQPVMRAVEDRSGLIFAAKTTASGSIALLVAFTFNFLTSPIGLYSHRFHRRPAAAERAGPREELLTHYRDGDRRRRGAPLCWNFFAWSACSSSVRSRSDRCLRLRLAIREKLCRL